VLRGLAKNPLQNAKTNHLICKLLLTPFVLATNYGGVVFIGMPGLEQRLSRYPQLYSRVGFVHAFRPLSAAQVCALLQRKWIPAGVTLPAEGVADEEALAAIIRITGGNFRLLHRLLTQIARRVEINALRTITGAVVAAPRESLAIGTA
jgi:DNA transposition AAA+ family ATPase